MQTLRDILIYCCSRACYLSAELSYNKYNIDFVDVKISTEKLVLFVFQFELLASLTSKDTQMEDNGSICKFCAKLFENPVLISCGHSICLNCAEIILSFQRIKKPTVFSIFFSLFRANRMILFVRHAEKQLLFLPR